MFCDFLMICWFVNFIIKGFIITISNGGVMFSKAKLVFHNYNSQCKKIKELQFPMQR